MNRLEAYAKNLFFTIDVARPRVQKFVFNHIQRLKAINNPNFAQIIIKITALWESLFGNIETYDEVLNEQVSFTKQVNKIMKEFTDKVVIDLEPVVVVKFKKVSTTYDEFFPHGKTEYHSLAQDMALALMDRMVKKSHDYAADIGINWEPEFKDIYDKFKALLESQELKMGEVDHTSSDYKSQFGPLCVQLFRNMCTILDEYAEQPERMLDFFDQTIVNFESHIHPLKIVAGTKQASDLTFGVNDTLVITSKFEKALKFFFAPTADSEIIGVPKILSANAKVKIKAIDAGAPENQFVIFINETDTDANIEVRLE